MATTSVTMFSEEQKRIYVKSEIYDPDIHNLEDQSSNGLIIPKVYSLVVDDETGNKNQLYYVKSVDSTTYKSNLQPIALVTEESSTVDRILSYGNDLFRLYFDKITYTSESKTYMIYRLFVDDKFALMGNHSSHYRLFITTEEGTKICISQAYDSSMKPVGDGKVSIAEVVEGSGIRKCLNCYTEHELATNDTVDIYIYDAADQIIAQATLLATKASAINDLTDSVLPIIDFTVEANQQSSETGTIYLFKNQDKEQLTLYVYLKFKENDTVIKKRIAVDNVNCFMYGWDSLDTTSIGIQNLTFKYFLNTSIPVELDESSSATVSQTSSPYKKVVATTINIEIIDNSKYNYKKLSFIPYWKIDVSGSTTTKKWEYRVVGYSADPDDTEPRALIIDTGILTPTSPETTASGAIYKSTDGNVTINGIRHNAYDIKYQSIIEAKYITADNIQSVYTQIVYYTIKNPDTSASSTKFLISDYADFSKVYGSDSNGYKHPRIVVSGTTAKSYNIPADVFGTTTTFLDNFYYQANPPVTTVVVDGTTTSTVIVPTHFTIFSIEGSTLNEITTKIPITGYTETLPITDTEGIYQNKTLLLEFSKLEANNKYTVLYGVPVFVE